MSVLDCTLMLNLFILKYFFGSMLCKHQEVIIMADEDIFIPYLGDASEDVISNSVDKVEYILAFALINPGFTSESYEDYMVSLSTFIAKYPDNLEQAAREFENSVQRAIELAIPESGFTASVKVVPVSDTEVKFDVVILNQESNIVTRSDQMHNLLNLG